MAKPLGISLTMDANMLPRMQVVPQDRVTDLIWDAVREAICANMTPEVFRREAAAAWEHELKQDAGHARKLLTR